MSTVTQDMILEYIRKKGGRVKNVDLVKHFRKHLLFEDKEKKEQARELFKETVNSVAVIRQEEGEKFLYIKEEFSNSQQRHTSSSPSRTSSSSGHTSPLNASLQSVQSRSSQPPSITTTNSYPNVQQRSNLGRPTDLSNGRPMSQSSLTDSSPARKPQPNDMRPTTSYQYQNGTNELEKPEERSVSPKRKSPIPAPKPSDRSSRGVSPPNHHNYTGYPVTGNSPRVLSPPRSNNSPRVMSPPRSVGRRTDEGVASSLSHSVPSSSSFYSQSPRQHPPQSPSRLPPQSPSRPPPQPPQSRPVTQTTPTHQSSLGGRGQNKKRIEISGPVGLSNGPIPIHSFPVQNPAHPIPYTVPSVGSSISTSPLTNDKDLFDRYTSALENIGSFTSIDVPSLGSTLGNTTREIPTTSSSSSNSTTTSNPPHVQPVSSENSSLSSTSANSTSSPPPADFSYVSNQPKPIPRPLQAGSGGVQQLIQQYTVPPGAVPTSPPPADVTLSPNRSARVNRSTSSITNNSSGNVVFRRQQTPPDGKVQRSHSNVGSIPQRRSRLIERSSNLDTLTRQSIKGTHKISHRLSKNSDELVTNSKEELPVEDHDRDSPVNERDDDFTFDIEPLEKEWMMALVNGNMDEVHRILMTDNTFINKKGFLHGWTALHWAVKESNEELIRSLIISGSKVDMRSNGGLTPLHIAAESNNEPIARLLVYEYNASTNIRDHSGRRPIDMLHPFARESLRATLRNDLKENPKFRNTCLTIAMGASQGIGPANAFHIPRDSTSSSISTLRRNWASTGHLLDTQTITDKGSTRRYQLSPRVARKGFSFRRKKYQVNAKRDSNQSEYYHERKES